MTKPPRLSHSPDHTLTDERTSLLHSRDLWPPDIIHPELRLTIT